MHLSPIAHQLTVFLLVSSVLSGCGPSSATPSPVQAITPVPTHTRIVPSPIPSIPLQPSSTPTATRILVEQPTDWNTIPGIGIPARGEGVILTVIHVTDISPTGNTLRRLIIDIRLRNDAYPSLTISPSAFTIIHSSGASFAVDSINFTQPARDQQQLAQHQQLQASLLVSVEFPVEELALAYVPAPDISPVHIRLQAVPLAPDDTLADLDATSLVFVEGDLPASFRASEVFTSAPPALALAGVEPPQRFAGQLIQQDEPKQIMNVMLLFFNNLDSVDGVYTTVEQNEHESIEAIGERASWRETGRTIQFRQLTFKRCQAVALIQLSGRTEEEFVPKTIVVEYAKRLDQRLQKALCS